MDRARTAIRRAITAARALPGVALLLVGFISGVTPEVLELLADLSQQDLVDTAWLSAAVTEWSARAIVWLGVAATVVRRVTPVPAELVGLDPVRTVVSGVHPEGPSGP
jgi:hypothetical protein